MKPDRNNSDFQAVRAAYWSKECHRKAVLEPAPIWVRGGDSNGEGVASFPLSLNNLQRALLTRKSAIILSTSR
jgi:hypothetical protein